MSVYHQMGDKSHNLLYEDHLSHYAGAVLSPVNYTQSEAGQLVSEPPSEGFRFVLDPQLYYPHAHRGKLPQWKYFPKDVDTADQASTAWWRAVNGRVASTARSLGCTAVASPAVVPGVYSLSYYSTARDIATDLQEKLAPHGIQVLQTAIASLNTLAEPNAPEEIASVVTGGTLQEAYLVFVSDVHPRREFLDPEALKGAMRLIKYLEQSGIRALVGFCSSDLILWKAAGAHDCATGKFFNLRRFTPSRWEPPPKGGGQLPYWYEEALMAFLRLSDLVRVRRAGALSPATLNNPYSGQILEIIDHDPKEPWLGLSWRLYMYWFMDFERRFSKGEIDPDPHLRATEGAWAALDESGILMQERTNNGDWVRSWRRAVLEAFR